MYANLVYATPGLQQSQILDYFKDGSFGVKPGQVEQTETPNCLVVVPPSAHSPHCDDVTIQRDDFGVPHIYGADRAALMFGIGYATGEDRLFLADALRHAGRGDLSSFAGGANVAQDRDTFENAPYANDAELQAQFDRADDLYGQRGVQIQEDAQNYVDGINQWIAETKINPTKLDALYALTNHPLGPDPWKPSDVVATGALVAGIFGKGGGDELGAATALEDAKQALGASAASSSGGTSAPPTIPTRRAPSTSRSSPTGSRRRASRAGWRCPIRARCGASASSPTQSPQTAPSAIRRAHCSRASTRSPRPRTPSSSGRTSPRADTRSPSSAPRPATSLRSC